jgi:hypothetical protein
VATYLIGEQTIIRDLAGEQTVMATPQARMRGLCDYHDNPSTLTLVECAFDIDVRRWQRRGLLIPNTTFLAIWLNNQARTASLKVGVISADEVHLFYRVRMPGKRWQQMNQRVFIIWRPCRLGGRRPWLLCPACSRRAAILYLGGTSWSSFSCRRCAKLKYDSQRSGPRLRLMRKAQKLRRQLGGSGLLWEPFPQKPPAMQWRRYERIKELAIDAEKEWRLLSEFLF